MSKKYNFRKEKDIVADGGDNRVHIRLSITSLGVTGEQSDELDVAFTALSAIIESFLDDNAENFRNIFPETED
jgi:hypothetical protein